MAHSFLDRTIKDKSGKITLWQTPNWPLIGWLGFKVLGYFPFPQALKNGFDFTSTAFIIVWAYLELTTGVNYARRLLGALVLIAVVIPKFT